MKSALVLLALSFTGASFAAELDVHMHSTTTFKKGAAKDSFEKINEVTTSDVSLSYNGPASTYSKKAVNNDTLTYSIEKNVIHIQDEKAAVDAEVAANVERSIFGKIKSFSISGENFENAYYQNLQKQGLIDLANLDKLSNQRKSLNISNQVCSVDKSTEITTCEQDIDLKINNTALVVSVALVQIGLEDN